MKISIVIPTRNGSRYLRHSVATCLADGDPNLEVIVSDNNSRDDTKAIIEEIADPRLIYANTGMDLSMRQNFEFALSKASGDYLIFIGDDDGIVPHGIATLRSILQTYKPDAVGWRHLTYIWPPQNGGSDQAILKFRYRDFCGPARQMQPARMLQKLLDGRTVTYRDGINIYHGCVSRALIEQIRAVTGEYFFDQIPDCYTSLANLWAARSYVWVRNPISISGESPKSNGAAFETAAYQPSGQQVKLAQNFIALAGEDPVKGSMDIRILAKAAFTYALLNKVNGLFFGNRLAISHTAWRPQIIKEVHKFKGRKKYTALNLLNALFLQYDPSYQPDPALDVRMPENKAAEQPGPAKRKPLPRGWDISTVSSAARMLGKTIGQPYTPRLEGPSARLQHLYHMVRMRLLTNRT
jgi:glycosyltransferase involved in cell wall biosynthesis